MMPVPKTEAASHGLELEDLEDLSWLGKQDRRTTLDSKVPETEDPSVN